MPGPVQHLTPFVVIGDHSGNPVGGLNADQPAGFANAWTDAPLTDPSSNNLVDGPRFYRNQLVVMNALQMRTFRDGGSGRPQYRKTGLVSGLTLIQKTGMWFQLGDGSQPSLTFDVPVTVGSLVVYVLCQLYVLGEGHESDFIPGLTNGSDVDLTNVGPSPQLIYDSQPGHAVGLSEVTLQMFFKTAAASADGTAKVKAAGHYIDPLIYYKLLMMEYGGAAASPFDQQTDNIDQAADYSRLRDTAPYTVGADGFLYFTNPALAGLAVGAFVLSNNTVGGALANSLQPATPFSGVFEWNSGGSVQDHIAGDPIVSVLHNRSASGDFASPQLIEGTPSATSLGYAAVGATFDKA